MRAILVLLAVASPAVTAFADDDTEPPKSFHKGQLGLSARFGLGVRGIATYDPSVYCGKEESGTKFGHASVCTGRTPLALDLEAAYGVSGTIELLLELRIGLEQDFGAPPTGADGPRSFHLSPGARFFFSETSRAKLFVQPQLVFDFTDHPRGNDFGVRGFEGLWIDLHRSYGIYFYIAETLEFRRWLSASFEAGIGFQGRYP